MRHKRVWIMAGILLVVTGAVYLLLRLPASADIDSAVHTTVEDFTTGSFYHTGLTRRDDGEVTLLAIGIAGTWLPAQNPQDLPPVWGHAMVKHTIGYTTYVYVMGGQRGAGWLTSDIYYSRIDPVLHEMQPFVFITNTLPYTYGVKWHTAAVVGDYVYFIGGADISENSYDGVWFSRFNPDGTLGAWQPTASLPGPRAQIQAVEMNGYIYVVGGQPASSTCADTVFYAHPDPLTGAITQWLTATASLPYVTCGHSTVEYQVPDYPGRVYVIGGWGPTTSELVNVYFAQPSVIDGDIDVWTQTIDMPTPLKGAAALAFNGELVFLGGFSAFGGTVSTTRASLIDINTGEIIPFAANAGWYDAPALSSPRYWHSAVLGPDGYIYVLGGTTNLISPEPLTDGILNVGATAGQAGDRGYAQDGWYIGPPIELARNYRPQNFNWTVDWPNDVSWNLQYRTLQAIVGAEWSPWTTAPKDNYVSADTIFTYTVPFTASKLFRFQYRAFLTTSEPLSYTPALQRFELVYDVLRPPTFFKTSTPPSGQDVLPGQRITYTISFTNINNLSPITELVIRDILSTTMSLDTGTIMHSPGITLTYYPVTRQLVGGMGSLLPLEGGRISFAVVVSPSAPAGTQVINEAQFRSYEVDADQSTIHYVATGLDPLVITKTAAPPDGAGVMPDQVISYTLTYSNPNNLTLANVVVTDVLPAHTAWVTDSWSSECAVNGDELRCLLPTLTPNAAGQIQFEVRVASPVTSGVQISNTAYSVGCVAGVPGACRSGSSNVVTHYVSNIIPPEIAKQAVPPSGQVVTPGALITYTLLYTNPSNGSQLTGANVSDVLPPGLELVAGSCVPACVVSGQALTWTIGTGGVLDPGDTGQVSFVGLVNDQAVGGTTLSNVADLNSEQVTVQSNATGHPVRVPYDLVVRKSDGVRKAEAGQVVMYTIAFTNLVPSGIVTLTGVVLTDELLTPDWAAFVAGTVGTAVISPTARGYSVGVLGPNQSDSITLSVKVSDTLPPEAEYPVLTLINRVTIHEDGTHGADADLANNVSVDKDIIRGPDLVIRNISSLPSQIQQNSTLHIEADVVNEGVSPAVAWDHVITSSRWMALELYAKPAGFVQPGPPQNPQDHVGGWCATNETPCPSASQRGAYLGFILPPVYPLDEDESTRPAFNTALAQTGVYSIYMQVDVANPTDPSYGRVQEADEDNNVVFLGQVRVAEKLLRVYLPLVLKKHPSYLIFLPIVMKAG